VTTKGVGIADVTIVLSGTDDQGNPVNLSTTTNGQGFYEFTGLAPGTYTIDQPSLNFPIIQSIAGTVGGSGDGSVQTNGDIGAIVLKAGDQGINYDFNAVSFIG
jgi:hypothetical protein